MKTSTVILVVALGMTVAATRADAASRPLLEFSDITRWINSPPLTMADLRGKVVLIDFWAYSCINCLHAIPHVEHLHETYKDRGLVVIGVHSPEFAVEKSPANVIAATKRLGITYPVAIDNDLATWKAWRNQYWPTEYLIDQNGQLIGKHVGEGDDLRMENAIRLLLGLDMLPMNIPSAGDHPLRDRAAQRHP